MTDDSLHATNLSPRPIHIDVMGSLSGASARAGLVSLAERLERVRAWLCDDLTLLEAKISELVARSTASDDLARQAAAHLLARPGKRIRPICVMLGAQLTDVVVDDRIREVAVACELVHAATLLHDDVIDEGAERRGAAAARMVYGNSASILAGDHLLIEALQRVARAGSPALLDSMLATIDEMVAAEALQLAQRDSWSPDRATYLQVIEGKTASLFRWALTAAARLSEDDGLDIAALSEAGNALGMAFQLIDDVLDLEGDPARTGKDLFADLMQGKLTWPLIIASEHDRALAADVRALIADFDADKAAGIVARIRETGAVADTRAFAGEQRMIARAALATLPQSRARHAIEAVIDAAIERRK